MKQWNDTIHFLVQNVNRRVQVTENAPWGITIKVNRKVQEEPQAEVAGNPDTRGKRKCDTD